MNEPYYQDDAVTIYHGDCREVLSEITADVLVTDPPYPNKAGHFDNAVETARGVLGGWRNRALVFWTEMERPPILVPLVAIHIWHRTNVNGRPYEPIYEFAPDGSKRRSDVLRHAAVFGGVGPGCWEYLGHPTQKPVALMQALITRTDGVVFDPFAGSGATLHAAKNLGRMAVGVEIEERYCEIAARRLSQEVFNFGEAA